MDVILASANTIMRKTNSGLKAAGTAAVLLLFLSGCAADGHDASTVFGGAIGGGAGAAIGQAVGGRDGAIIGGAIGGATGAAVGSNHNTVANAPAREARRDDDEDGYRRHGHGRHEGERRHRDEEDD